MSSRAHSSATSPSSSSSSDRKVRNKPTFQPRIQQLPIPREKPLRLSIMTYVSGASRDVRFIRKKVTAVYSDGVADGTLYWVRDKRGSSQGSSVQSQEPPLSYQPVQDGHYVPPMGSYYGHLYYGYGGQTGVSGGKQQHEGAAHEIPRATRPRGGVPPQGGPYATGAMPPPPQGDA